MCYLDQIFTKTPLLGGGSLFPALWERRELKNDRFHPCAKARGCLLFTVSYLSRNCWCEFLVARHRTCVSKRLGVQDEATLAACVKNRKKYLHQLLIETATMVARFKTACGGIWKCFFSSVFPFLSALFLSGLPAPLFFL